MKNRSLSGREEEGLLGRRNLCAEDLTFPLYSFAEDGVVVVVGLRMVPEETSKGVAYLIG